MFLGFSVRLSEFISGICNRVLYVEDIFVNKRFKMILVFFGDFKECSLKNQIKIFKDLLESKFRKRISEGFIAREIFEGKVNNLVNLC